MSDLNHLMIEWTKLDKELKDINEKASIIRKQKESINQALIATIKENNLQDNVFSIPSLQMNVVCKEQSSYESMSYKFLEEKFNEHFSDSEKATELLNFIKTTRKKTKQVVLKGENVSENINEDGIEE